MHILIAIIGALAAAFWAFTYFVNAARQGQDAVNDVKGAIRGAQWSKKVGQRMIESLTDPREAAAILMYQIAAYDGAVTERQRLAIIAEMKRAFAADHETAEGLFAFARAATGQINDAANSLKKILKPIEAACAPNECRDLVDMLLKIAEVEGPASDTQHRLIAEVKRALSPA